MLGHQDGDSWSPMLQVAKSADLGSNDRLHFTITHLGHLLHSGDTALGYDLQTAQLADAELEKQVEKGMSLPDVILVMPSPHPIHVSGHRKGP